MLFRLHSNYLILVMRKIHLYCLSSLAFLISFVLAYKSSATHIIVSGTIPANTTWSVDTVKVFGDIAIPDSVRLTIAIGTMVEFHGSYKIEVQGSVRAIGTTQDSMRFELINVVNHWEGFHFNNSSSDSSIFEYCIFNKTGGNSTPFGEAMGGAFWMWNANHLRISHSSFTNNFSKREGGAIYCFDSSPIIDHNFFTKNKASGAGGVIHIESNNLSVVSGSFPLIEFNDFIDNTGSTGGVIYCNTNGRKFHIKDNLFYSNTSTNVGGAIACVSSDPFITRNIIRKNIAEKNEGGGIYLANGDCKIYYNTIDSNVAYDSRYRSHGGAIAILQSFVTIKYNTITNNMSQYGGAVSARGGSFGLHSNYISGNEARANGSVAYGESGALGSVGMYIDSNTIVRNKRAAFACIYGNSGTTVKVRYNRIDSNDCNAVWAVDRRSEILSNHIGYNNGYGVRSEDYLVEGNNIIGNLSVGIHIYDESIIRNNTISMNGSGISCQGFSPEISNNRFYHNGDSTLNGGALLLTASSAMVFNNSFRNNLAYLGGAVYLSNGGPTFTGNLFSNNQSIVHGGAVYLADDTVNLKFYNNTVSQNLASGRGGGLYSKAQNWADIRNSIFYQNDALGGDELYVFYDNYDPNFYNCNIEGGVAAFDLNFGTFTGAYNNCLDTLPNFLNPSSGSGYMRDSSILANWSLKSNSVLIDAGDTAGLALPLFDLDLNARVQGTQVDIGAYESRPALMVELNKAPTVGICQNDSFRLIAVASKPVTTFTWMKDGTTLSGNKPHWYIHSMSPADTGFYQCIAISTSEIDTSDAVFLGIRPLALAGKPGRDTALCPGSELVLKFTQPFGSYIWNDGSRSDSFTVTKAGRYFASLVDSNGCAVNSDTTNIQIQLVKKLELGPDLGLCFGDSSLLNAGSGYRSYLWLGAKGTDSIAWVTKSGLVTLTVSDSNSCFQIDSINAYLKKSIVQGGITDFNSMPISGAWLYLLEYNAADTSLRKIDSTQTDALGKYFIELDRTDLYLRMESPNMLDLPMYYPNALVIQDADTLGINKCDTVTRNLQSQQSIYSALFGSIGGHISQLKGLTPISPIRATGVVLYRNATPWRYTTTNNGWFRFVDLNDGVYDIAVDRMFVNNSLAPQVQISIQSQNRDSLLFRLLPQSLIYCGSLGIEDAKRKKVLIEKTSYSTYQVQIPNLWGKSSFEVWDLSGRMILSHVLTAGKIQIINLEAEAKGIYLLKVSSEDKVLTEYLRNE